MGNIEEASGKKKKKRKGGKREAMNEGECGATPELG